MTGLSRAGKTVFITSLVHNLTRGGRLPVFRVSAERRLTRAALQAQPDDAIPRFAYEDHLASLTMDRTWPESTRRISELRLTLEFERQASWRARNSSLTVDIIDYPGEWLLDLPLLGKSYAQVAGDARCQRHLGRASLAATWRGGLQGLAAGDKASERGRPGAGGALYGLSPRVPRGPLCAFNTAARSLFDARRSRRVAGPDLRASSGRGGPCLFSGVDRGHDGAALRVL